ncbi:MAG: queuosine salvage family protein [Candidatus Shapirobacteria bacterium]
MIDVLKSTKFILDQSKYARVSQKAICSLTNRVGKKDLQASEIGLVMQGWPLDTLLQLIFIFNTINFCFWAGKNKEKWTVKIGDEELDGSIALFRCIEKETEKNSALLSGSELANLSRSHLQNILTGNTTIPLFNERLRCLNEAGRVLEKQFGNSFIDIYKRARGDAMLLADLLVTRFPCFNDISTYGRQIVGFYKRAQLNSKMISDALVSHGEKELKNLDKLTAFADYKIPQMLRKLGVIKYSKELAEKIDSYVLIGKDSEEEVEIRVATIWAVEIIRQEVEKRYGFVTAADVDTMLWNRSQTKQMGDKPYHRTLTIAY